MCHHNPVATTSAHTRKRGLVSESRAERSSGSPERRMRDSLRRMLDSLSGLSVGDAFGQRFFSAEITESCLGRRTPPPAPWHWTDDTNMALSIVVQPTRFGEIDPDRLAESFARRYDPSRGYEASRHTVLRRIGAGEHWATVTGEQPTARPSGVRRRHRRSAGTSWPSCVRVRSRACRAACSSSTVSKPEALHIPINHL